MEDETGSGIQLENNINTGGESDPERESEFEVKDDTDGTDAAKDSDSPDDAQDNSSNEESEEENKTDTADE